MPRAVNAVDFWRGFALVSIFINHIPGVFYERFTHRNLSLSELRGAVRLPRRLVAAPRGRQAGGPHAHAQSHLSPLGARAHALCRAYDHRDAGDRDAGRRRAHPREPADPRVEQRGRRLQRSGRHPHRAGAAEPPARLLRHPAALRRPDAGGAADCDHPSPGAELAGARLPCHLSLGPGLPDHHPDLAHRGAVVLQSAVLAAGVRAGLSRHRASAVRAAGCAPTSPASGWWRCRS